MSDSTRRRLPLRYLFAALAAVFVLPILVWLVWGWIEATRLDRALDALEARKEPLDIATFSVTPATEEQREASHLYAQAGKLVDDRRISTEQAARLSKSIEGVCSHDVEPSVRSQQARVLLEFEDSYQPVFDLLERASQLDALGWDDADRPNRQSMQEMRPITLTRARPLFASRGLPVRVTETLPPARSWRRCAFVASGSAGKLDRVRTRPGTASSRCWHSARRRRPGLNSFSRSTSSWQMKRGSRTG
jgi:hypothetical protein